MDLLRLGIIMLFSLSSSLALGRPRVLCLGDSLTEGQGVAANAAWPSLLPKELSALGSPEADIINAGISGSTSASGAGRLKWQLRAGKPVEVIILALGANDGLRGLDVSAMQKSLTETIAIGKKAGSMVILAGMRVPPNYGAAYQKEFDSAFAAIAAKEQVTLLPFLLEGVAGEAKYNQADGIHPNEEGHKIIAKLVAKTLAPVLKDLATTASARPAQPAANSSLPARTPPMPPAKGT